jgi:uncharacterized membrane protein YkvA (DUF1232 family)
MLDRVRFLKRLAYDLPRQLRLAYCLFRDPRVPIAAKAGVAAALGVVLIPAVELPSSLPLIGELDAVAVTIAVLRLFIALCPQDVVTEQEQLIAERRSRFDLDVAAGERLALALWQRLGGRRAAPELEAA